VDFLHTPPLQPPTATAEQIRLGMLRELYSRSQGSIVVGFLPIPLLIWAHADTRSPLRLLLWSCLLLAIQSYRLWVARRFLRQPEPQQAAQYQRWYRHQWVGVLALAIGWVDSFALLDPTELGTLFYLHLIFLIGLSTIMLSTIGIDCRLYAGFLLLLVAGTLSVLYAQHAEFLARFPIIAGGFPLYAFMLLVRSRGEYRRTRDWVAARLNRQLLLAELNNALAEERAMRAQLHQQSEELAARNRELSELAVRDGLTHAFRRGHIEGELRRLIKGLQRHPDDFCVLMLDIDFFKRVNDQYGHSVGDGVLRRLATTAQAQLRENDLFGRWGGEEFVVLMPHTRIEEAMEAAQRLRRAVAALVFEVEGATFQITISIGAAQLQAKEDADGVVARADAALYAAKHAGRNCVRPAPAPAPALMAD